MVSSPPATPSRLLTKPIPGPRRGKASKALGMQSSHPVSRMSKKGVNALSGTGVPKNRASDFLGVV